MTLRQRWKQTSLTNKILVEIAVIGVVVSAVNLWLIDRSATQTEAQIDRAILALGAVSTAMKNANTNQLLAMNESAFEAASALESAANATQDQLGAQREALRLERRAWVGIVGARPINFRAGQTGEITFVYRNTGQTPARKLRVQTWEKVVRGKDPLPPFDPPGNLPDGGSVLQPGAMEETPSILIKNTMTPESIKALQGAEFNVIVMGRIRYTDVFDRTHWTTFCTAVKPPALTETLWCAKYNDAD